MSLLMDHMSNRDRGKAALITGASRGIGAETALVLADHGYHIAFTYRNKATRAQKVVHAIEQRHVQAFASACDITNASDRTIFMQQLPAWADYIDILVLNASGGMERDLVAANEDYPMLINRDAQLALVDAALPRMVTGSTIVFVTSHWAHLYGRMEQIPAYEPVAASKHAGEQALRARQEELAAKNIRLIIVTGDLIEGTITPKLLERTAPGLLNERRTSTDVLPTAASMGCEVALAALNPMLPTGSTVVVGAPLESLSS